MAYQKLSVTTLISAIQKQIKEGTGLKCLDHVPQNETSPFYFAELVKTVPNNTKTMFRDVMTVWIHCIAEKSESSVGIYQMIDQLQEAMTEDIELPDPYELIMQVDGGVQTIKTDETGEKHAVIPYDFTVCYGFKCK